MLWRLQLGAEGQSLNHELATEILRRSETEPGAPSFNRGGWRSHETLLVGPSPALVTLHALVRASFDEASGERNNHKRWLAWAIVNRNGSHHERHNHMGAWAGIYYVTTSSGDTVFETPTGVERVTPRAGLLVITPALWFHSVDPCHDEAPRITIGFEAR